ncbi:MAG: aldo/keto reductase [Chloroflexota bacterium]
MKAADEDFVMHNGVRIPKIGFGTWQISNGKDAYDAVSFALQSGYRHIDTAFAYRNEESVGRAVRDSGIERENIFITSKLPAEIKSYDEVLKHFDQTMKNLGMERLDLYLIHAPWPWTQIGSDHTEGNIKVWKAFEEIYKSGRCRSIGVSNFVIRDLKAILDNGEIVPMANQIKYFIGHTQEEVTDFCRERNILVEGYSPLATGAILGNPTVEKIAKKYDVSLPQICIRYVLQRDVLPLPKSTHKERILQNIDVDFEIIEEDMNYLKGLKELVKTRW